MFEPHRIPSISPADAHSQLSDVRDGEVGPLLVDVRESNEFAEVRAAGAVLSPLSTFAVRHAELPKDRPLLMICQSGARSGRATAFLIANGWPDVKNVVGGTLAWAQAGLPVRKGPPGPGEGELAR